MTCHLPPILCLALAACLSMKLSAQGIENDPFTPFLRQGAPKVLREAAPDPKLKIPSGVKVQRVFITSRTVPTTTGPVTNEVYALIASPEAPGPHPGLLVLHGGKGQAEELHAIGWAKRGYISVAVDLPGIGDPETMKSTGAWRSQKYGDGRWTAAPDISSSVVFDAIVAGLDGFRLLQAQPGVDPERLGIAGISWGGYTTTMLCSLLGPQVKAGFSVFGSGSYEQAVFKTNLMKMPAEERTNWIKYLDPVNRTGNMRAAFFFAAASNDAFFFPPAVMATYQGIPGEKNLIFAPNADHTTHFPGGKIENNSEIWAKQEVDWFDHYLKGQGPAFPVVELPDAKVHKASEIKFMIRSERPLTRVRLYYSAKRTQWTDRNWLEIEPTPDGQGGYRATIPPAKENPELTGDHFFVMATDDRPVSVSSLIYEYEF